MVREGELDLESSTTAQSPQSQRCAEYQEFVCNTVSSHAPEHSKDPKHAIRKQCVAYFLKGFFGRRLRGERVELCPPPTRVNELRHRVVTVALEEAVGRACLGFS